MTTKCRRCGDQLEGSTGTYCIACYAKVYQPCGECMIVCKDGHIRPRRVKRVELRKTCKNCNGEGWVLTLDERIARTQ